MDGENREKLLNEYVLSDVGKIYMGSYGSVSGREWIFGQYDDAALPVTVYLLERCGLPHTARADPVLISRAITKMVNCIVVLFMQILDSLVSICDCSL